MTKKSNKSIFKLQRDRENLYLLVNFRIAGFGINLLATLFHCDKGTIRYECRKYDMGYHEHPIYSMREVVATMKNETIPRSTREWVVEDGERINRGHSYADYIKNLSPVKNHRISP